jgi:hypothetical protein
MIENTLRWTLIAIAVVVPLLFGIVTIAAGGRLAIEAGNVILMAMATGIVVAYAPVVRQALQRPLIEGGDILAIGIFIAWLGVAYARGVSILWRLADKPVDWLDSPIWGLHIALSTIGAMCHLVAPGAVEGRVPTRQWIRIGLWVAAGVAGMGLLLVLHVD